MGRLTALIEEADYGELLNFLAETVLDAIGVVGFAEEEAASLRQQVRLAQWSLTDGPAERISLTNTRFTIDAMGCQKAIVEVIEDGGGDFEIAVKDNQQTLREAIATHFEKHLEGDFEDLRYRPHETHEDTHGRIDERSYSLTKVPTEGSIWEDWPSVKAIGYALLVTQVGDGPETVEVRYDIASRSLSGKRFGEAVRGHWSIESMHWVLDVNFREDDSRTLERTLGEQTELAAAVLGVAAEATPGQRQPARQDAPLPDESGLPDGRLFVRSIGFPRQRPGCSR